MKTNRNLILSVIALLFLIPAAQGQILKKLKKKIEKGAEQTVIDKTNEKVQHEADKAMEEILEGQGLGQYPNVRGGKMADMAEVRAVYEFSYVYTLEMRDESNNEIGVVDMLLHPHSTYWGMRPQTGAEVTMVHDAERELMVIFSADEDSKTAMAFSANTEGSVDEVTETPEAFEVREIPGKTILGYDCLGFEVETESYLVTVYNTFDAEVSLSDAFQMRDDLPKNFNPDWIKKDGNYGLLMEMHMKDKSGEGGDVSMQCLDLSEISVTLNKSDFDAVQLPGGKQ